jgi:hypothetical protein
MLQTLTFGKEDKACLIALEDLDRTMKLEDANGKLPKSAPIDHANLVKKLIVMAKEYAPGNKPVIGPITVKQANCKRMMWKGNIDECPLEHYLVERLVLKVGFGGTKSFEDREDTSGSMAIGLSYNEKGIQMAVGHNVRICQNLNVFGENVFSTYGAGSVPFEKGMQLAQGWMQNLKPIMEQNRDYIQKLMAIEISEDTRLRLFGKIYEQAIRFNEGERNDAPLNVTECNRMVAKGFSHITEKESVTAWDLTNWCTSVLKPETSDMVTVMNKNARLNNWILQEFGVN